MTGDKEVKLLVPEWLRGDYNKIRSTKIYGDTPKELIPKLEIREKVSKLVEELPYVSGDKLKLDVDVIFCVTNPDTRKEDLLREGRSHAASYLSRINKSALLSCLDTESLNVHAKAIHPPDFSKRVKVSGELKLIGKTNKEVLNEMERLNRVLFESDDLTLCHYFEYSLNLENGKTKELFHVAYISKLIPQSLREILLYQMSVDERKVKLLEKPPYSEAYSILDLPLMIEHFSKIAPSIFDYYKNRGISIKCLNYVDKQNPRRHILDIISKYDQLEKWQLQDLEKYFMQLQCITRRWWPKEYYPEKKGEQILINEEGDFNELVSKLLMFEIIANCHPLGFENLNDEEIVSSPYWLHRDYDAKTVDYETTRKNIESILKMDREIGLKKPIIAATGSPYFGFHIIYGLYYPQMQVSPVSTEKLETYSQRSHGRQMLDSIRALGKTLSLLEIAKLNLNVAVDSDVVGVEDADGVLDHEKNCINSGWKGPGSLNSNRKSGVYVFVDRVPTSEKMYRIVTSMEYVWADPSLLKMPKVDSESMWENYYALKSYVREMEGRYIQRFYYGMRKRKNSHPQILSALRNIVI